MSTPNLIQFEGRTVAYLAPEDLEQMESELTALRAENAALRSDLGKCSNVYEIAKDAYRDEKRRADKAEDALRALLEWGPPRPNYASERENDRWDADVAAARAVIASTQRDAS